MSDSKGAAIEKLIDDLWGRALDMTSPDFANDKDYETAQSNYKKHCLKELHAILAQEVKRGRIDELKRIMPPEQYKDYAKIAGREACIICGFNSEDFRRYLDERIKVLRTAPKRKAGLV